MLRGRTQVPGVASRAEQVRFLARGGMAVGTSTAIGAALSVPATALLVRSLGISAYGALAFALGVVALAATLADLGLANGVTRMSAASERDESNRWARSGVSLAVISGSAASLACVALALTMGPASQSVLLAASGLPLVLTVRALLAAHIRVRRHIGLVEGTYALGQVLYYGGAIALVAVGVATAPRVAFLRVLVAILILVLLIPIWMWLTAGATWRPAWAPLLRFSLPLMIAGVAWFALQTLDIIMLGLFAGTDSVGLYAPVLQTVDFITLILYALGAYYLPLASRMVAHHDVPGLQSIYATTTKWGLVLTAPLLSALIVAPGPLLEALFGSEYGGHTATLTARILSTGYAFTVATGQNAFSLMALGHTRAIAVRSTVALGINVALNALLIPKFGITGAAISTAVVYMGLNIANSVLIWKSAGLTPVRRDVVFVLGTAAILSILSFLIVDVAEWTDSLKAPLFTALVVGIGSVAAWAASAAPEERIRVFQHWQNPNA